LAGRYLVNFDSEGLPQESVDYLVVGSGIGGLYAAWCLHRSGAEVLVLTKRMVEDTNTERAQGGIAAAIGASDSPFLHEKDTLAAGAGLCNADAVRILVTEGPQRVRDLMAMGARFDRLDGGFALTREGAHSRRRILHASGDATGAEIQRVLSFQAEGEKIPILERHFAVDLLVEQGRCYGLLAYDEEHGHLKIFRSRVTILATGGAGHLYARTTNPEVATGDGIALAYRAGAEVADMEFVQFHPTALALEGAPAFLISEAVRGEGGILRNIRGERFMPRYHPQAELAPRDVVTRGILAEMAATGAGYVYLDVTHLPAEEIPRRFPTITRTCADWGLDITREPIPVAPAAHYMMGGVKTDLDGRTSIEGLYACGEVACPGVHGANRLASNSLLDGLVFGGRIARRAIACAPLPNGPRPHFACSGLREDGGTDYAALRRALQNVMQEKVGPLRTAQGLAEALEFFDRHLHLREAAAPGPEAMEVRNLLEIGHLVAEAAASRTESRGGHFRADYPEPKARWEKHIIFRRQ